jgi:sigma-B regulation protein RsbU (phosphoserine phosphatase)
MRPNDVYGGPADMNDARILIVDDVEDNRYTLGMLLDLEGYSQVAQACDGAEALERLGAEAFDLVLLDVMMPKLDGYQVLERLKAEGRLHRLPVVMISALQELDSVVRCIELGAEDYLPKPFNPVLLKARISACLEKKRLRDQTAAQLERMEAELRAARELQASMVPTRFPAPGPGNPLEAAAVLKPARELGGDFYDFFRVGDGTAVLVMADVSDKGVPAALFMARSMNAVRMLASSPGRALDPGEVLRRANDELARANDASMFVTLFLGAIDLGTGTLRYANAGHNEPYVLGSAGVRPVTVSKGMPLAVKSATDYATGTVRVAPGDVLFAFTDGVTEAMNSEGIAFGEERLEAVLAGLRGKSAAEIVSAATDAVQRFVGAAPQSDDIAALAVRFVPVA